MDAGANEKERKKNRALRQRWGDEVIDAGWVAVPAVLIMHWHEIGEAAAAKAGADGRRRKTIPTDLAVVLVLLKYWWHRDDAPYPSKETIAKMIGVDEKTVQRSLTRLRALGLISSQKRPGPYGTNAYTFDGLIEAMKPFAEIEKKNMTERRALREEQTRRRFAGMAGARLVRLPTARKVG